MDIRSFFKPKGGAAIGVVKGANKEDKQSTQNSKKRKNLSDSSPENHNNNKVKSQSKKPIRFDSDDDDDFVPATPPVVKKANDKVNGNDEKSYHRGKAASKKKNIIDSDSENEDMAPKSKKQRSETTVVASSVHAANKKEKPPVVSADHYFGKAAPKAKGLGIEKSAKSNDDKVKIEEGKENGGATSKPSSKDEPKTKQNPRVDALKPAFKEEPMDDFDDDDDFENSIHRLDESIHEGEQKNDGEERNKEKEEEKNNGLKKGDGASLKAENIFKKEKTNGEKMKEEERESVRKESEKKDVKIEKSVVKTEMKEPSEDKKEGSTPPKAAPDTGFAAKTLTPNFRDYKAREGPRNPGSKEVPEGAANCLEGLTFVITGVLESLERTEAQSIIEKYGGKVTQSVSKKTSYAVIGREAGPSKLQKVQDLKVKILDEDGLLQLIGSQPGKKSKFEVAAKAMIEEEEKEKRKAEEKEAKKRKAEEEEERQKPKVAKVVEKGESSSKALSTKTSSTEPTSFSSSSSSSSSIPSNPNAETELWVDKYKPKTLKQIVGQQGEGSNVRKLQHWLSNWHKWHTGPEAVPLRATGGRAGPKDDGRGLRAALLSGPPGVGKTTTATLVCKELGFTFVELNASDQRSQKSLKQVVAEALNNHTVVDFVGGGGGGAKKTGGQKHCLIMDEVDGMAGNEDRGGMQELIQLIKKTHIPIITMCNDRQSQKVRSLANYCLDLRFYRPRVDQIKGALMSICFKEGIKIQPPTLNNIIAMANHDIRQVIHNLSMWTADSKNLTMDKAEAAAEKAKKNLKIGPFEVIRKVFETTEETRKMSLIDKSDLFFHDYSLSPLFVQENYAGIIPNAAAGNRVKHLRSLSRAASAIAAGDLVDRKIRSKQNWSLLPTQAIFASVIPGEVMRGHWTGQCAFPSWLGKHSKGGKSQRQLQELKAHMRLNVSGSTTDLMLDYMTPLSASLTKPLVHREAEGVPEVIKILNDYDLMKEDMDNILELNTWPGKGDPMAGVASKTKAALTRTYNKEVHMTPYASDVSIKKSKKPKVDLDYEGGPLGEDEDDGGEESEEEPTPVAKKPSAKSSKESASSGGGGKDMFSL